MVRVAKCMSYLSEAALSGLVVCVCVCVWVCVCVREGLRSVAFGVCGSDIRNNFEIGRREVFIKAETSGVH